MWFFNSYVGMYMLQSVLHSIIALFIVERSLQIWDIEAPILRFSYRLSIIVLPVFMFPAFQFLNPDRGSFYFREDMAVFNSLRWLGIDIWGRVPLVVVFFFLAAAITTAIMFLQEAIPIGKDAFLKKQTYSLSLPETDILSMLNELTEGAHLPKPLIWIIDDENPLIFAIGIRNPAILISRPLIRMLNKEQMQSALAHELAHIQRRSNITTFVVFILRIVMFYNPVSLLVFRRLVQDDEHVCDDITVSITKDPQTLAQVLKTFYSTPRKGLYKFSAIKEGIETSSHNLLLQERITRIEGKGGFEDNAFRWGRYTLTMTAIIMISYFIV